MTEVGSLLVLPAAIRAADHRLARVIVAVFFGICGPVFRRRSRVRKSQPVRAPFNQQKQKKRRRDKAAEISSPYILIGYVLHHDASLARCYYGKQESVVSEIGSQVRDW